MSLMRHLRPGLIKMELATRGDPEALADPTSGLRARRALKEAVLEEIVDLFEAEGEIANASKLRVDFVNREKKASTALGGGMALPHVRSMQARAFQVALLRAPHGVWFDAPDDEDVRLFIAMVAPPYEDQQYLKLYRQISKAMLNYPDLVDAVAGAGTQAELRSVLKFYFA
jgi:mannitol/fructose-specific phosphotransferase system IIA component (Ntr-type)